MREIRQSGSEGGGAEQSALPTPIDQAVASRPSLAFLSGCQGTVWGTGAAKRRKES